MNTKTERTITFNRSNILEAADKLFCKSGVDKTTMDQIAQEAGYSKPTLYGYFKDKDEVYFALVLDFIQKLVRKVDKIINEHTNFTESFMKVCESLFRLATRYPLYFEGLISNININIQDAKTPQVYKDIYYLGEVLNEKLIRILQLGKEENVINQSFYEPTILFFIWSSISGNIRMINHKKEYLKMLHLNEKEFSSFCFERLLNACK